MIDPVVYLPDLWRAPDPTRRTYTNTRRRLEAETLRAGCRIAVQEKGALAS